MGQDAELLQSIREHVASHPGAFVLDASEAEHLRALVVDGFGLASDRLWSWEDLPAAARSTRYDGQDGLRALATLLPAMEEGGPSCEHVP